MPPVVPQGAVIYPSLFCIFINEIPFGINSTILLFADDTIAYMGIKSTINAHLQQDLNKLAIWERK